MIKFVICDDEELQRKWIRKGISEYAKDENCEIEITEYDDGAKFYQERPECDVLLLDIEMKDVNGIEVKNSLEKENQECAVIFITSHTELMPEAFGKNVYGFLEKPLQKEKLFPLLKRVVGQKNREKFFEIQGLSGVEVIKSSQILYFEAEGQYSKIHMFDRELLTSKPLCLWEKELSGLDFGRCHRSYYVNYHAIVAVKKEIELKNGEKIPLSRRENKIFTDNYVKFMIREAR